MSGGARTNAPHLVVGLCFLLLGVFLLLDRTGLVEFARVVEYWPLVLVLLGVSLMIQAVRAPGGSPARNEFPAGPLVLLVLVTLVASRVFADRTTASGSPVEDDVRLSAVLSERRAVVTDTFQAGRLTSVMGGTVLDLRQATIPPGEEAVVDLLTVMGGAVLHVPASWEVDVESTTIMGGVKDERNEPAREDRRRGRTPGARWDDDDSESASAPSSPAAPERTAVSPNGPAPRLVVRGFIMMGGLSIEP